MNPERVDYVNGMIEIGFTVDGVEELEIRLSENDAFRLHKMLLEQTNIKAKRERNQL